MIEGKRGGQQLFSDWGNMGGNAVIRLEFWLLRAAAHRANGMFNVIFKRNYRDQKEPVEEPLSVHRGVTFQIM